MLFLSLFCLARLNLTINDVVFGLWSGSGVIGERVSALCRTWLQLIPEVHIYTDMVSNRTLKSIVRQNNHLNVRFHIIHADSHPLVGTIHDDIWNMAQDRHIASIIDLWERDPNKLWYFFGDDDTFVYPETIVNFLSDKDPDREIIYGHVFTPFPEVVEFYQPRDDRDYAFAQGGAGFIVSQAMLKALGPHLRKCRYMFMSGNVPSDMRLSLCAYRYVGGPENYKQSLEFLHGDVPCKGYPRSLMRPMVSHHHIVPPMSDEIWHAQISVWKLQNGTERYVDWSHITLSDMVVPVGEEHRFHHIMWGWRIYDELLDWESEQKQWYDTGDFLRYGNFLTARKWPKPVFAKSDIAREKPIMYEQKFQRGITFQYICDEEIPLGVMDFDSFLLGSDYGTAFRVQCPKPRPFDIVHATESPLNVTYGEEDNL